MLTCRVKISLPERSFSGGKLGSKFATEAGPRREEDGVPELGPIGVLGFRFNLVVPRVPAGATPPPLGRGFDLPLMLIAAGSELPLPPPPSPLVVPPPPLVPPIEDEFPPEPPLPRGPFSAPPGTPGCLPSGEIATRADRFPCGTVTSGAGGAGEAESAIIR